jgi:hypothetical protein
MRPASRRPGVRTSPAPRDPDAARYSKCEAAVGYKRLITVFEHFGLPPDACGSAASPSPTGVERYGRACPGGAVTLPGRIAGCMPEISQERFFLCLRASRTLALSRSARRLRRLLSSLCRSVAIFDARFASSDGIPRPTVTWGAIRLPGAIAHRRPFAEAAPEIDLTDAEIKFEGEAVRVPVQVARSGTFECSRHAQAGDPPSGWRKKGPPFTPG